MVQALKSMSRQFYAKFENLYLKIAYHCGIISVNASVRN